MKTSILLLTSLIFLSGCSSSTHKKPNKKVSSTMDWKEQDISEGILEGCTEDLQKDIVFLDRFFGSIFDGSKTATTRRGIRCYRVGDEIPFRGVKTGVRGKAKITRVRLLAFQSIDDELGKVENTTAAGLQRGLTKIYGESISKQPLTVIYFDFLKSSAIHLPE